MVVYTGFKAILKRVSRELNAIALYIMIEFHSGPLSLRHEHHKTTSNQSSFHFCQNLRWSTSRPVPHRHQILMIVVLIVSLPIFMAMAINVCLCYRHVHDSVTVTVFPPTLISLVDFGWHVLGLVLMRNRQRLLFAPVPSAIFAL